MNKIVDTIKEMDKKTLILIIGGIGIILLLLILSLATKNKGGSSKLTYDDVEVKLVSAAQKFYEENPDYLPKQESVATAVTLNTLVENEYIQPLNKYIKNGDSCDARVVALKNGESYEYTPYLNCGEDYVTTEMYKKILEDNKITTSGVGLYSLNGSKVFRGEVKNNYVMLNNNLWRIMRIDNQSNIILISEFKTDTTNWDDRFNQEDNTTYGINDYNVSRIKETIERQYNNNELLTEKEQLKVVSGKVCVGARKKDQMGSINSIECSELSADEVPVRLILAGEFLEASIDPNCRTIQDKGCVNYNYLADFTSSYWTNTKGLKNTTYVYKIDTSGIEESRANTFRRVRYVVSLGTKTFYKSGSGLYDDPYLIK